MPVFLSTTDDDFEAAFARLLGAKREEASDVDDAVAAIIADVRARGDAAVIELTARLDRLELTPRYTDAMRYPLGLCLKIGLCQTLAMVPGTTPW